jgi:hypothetical protein
MVLKAMLFLHVLIFGFWIGADLAVLYVTRYVINERLSVQTRSMFARALFRLDTAPTCCLTLQIPVGLTLAFQVGLLHISGSLLALAWVLALAWMAVMLRMIHGNSPAGIALRRTERAFRLLLLAGFLISGVTSLMTGYPFVVHWLAVKAIIFAVLILATIGIDRAVKPFFPAMEQLIATGPTPELNAAIASSLTRAYPSVALLYASILAAAAVAIF